MRIHDGNCQGQPCSRTHAYKCRLCRTWFQQDVVDLGGSQMRPFPFYPFCSVDCANAAVRNDKGFHMFRTYVLLALQDRDMAAKYATAAVHADFDALITKTKEMN